MRTINHWDLYVWIVSLLLCVGLAGEAQQIAKAGPPTRPQVMDSYGKLPLSFEANQGQTDPRVRFLSRGSGYSLFLTEDSAVLSSHGQKAGGAVLRMKLLGANAHAIVAGARTDCPVRATISSARIRGSGNRMCRHKERLSMRMFILGLTWCTTAISGCWNTISCWHEDWPARLQPRFRRQ